MMKIPFLLLAVAVLHGVTGDWGVCICGAFLRSAKDGSRPDLDSKIVSKSSYLVEDCDALDAQKHCSDVCVEKFKLGTGGISLDFVTPKGRTFGALVCLELGKDIQKGEPAVFSKVCDGEWKFGMTSVPPYLCCKNGDYFACE